MDSKAEAKSNDELNDAIHEAKKLTPEERIKKLKEIAITRKEELKRMEKMILETESELEGEEKKKSMPVPEQKEVDINKLFSRDSDLEHQVAKEQPKKIEGEIHAENYKLDFARQLSESPAENLYKMTGTIYQGFQASGYVSPDQMNVLAATLAATEVKLNAIESGDYLASKDVSSKLVFTQSVIRMLQDKYRG